jgi:PAS domain S-box-containing protein
VGYDSLVADMQSVLDTLVPKEVEVQTREGKWYTMRIQLYRTLDNVIEGAVITFVDITETKRAEAAVQESESLFRQLTESLPQLVWTCRPDGFYDYLSPQWVEFTGVPEAQQLGFRWLDQVHPEDRSMLMTAWNKAIATGESFNIGFRLRHHSGDYHGFDSRVNALRDAAGGIVRWFGLNTDITPIAGLKTGRGKGGRNAAGK